MLVSSLYLANIYDSKIWLEPYNAMVLEPVKVGKTDWIIIGDLAQNDIILRTESTEDLDVVNIGGQSTNSIQFLFFLHAEFKAMLLNTNVQNLMSFMAYLFAASFPQQTFSGDSYSKYTRVAFV